ncbi:tetratricopeptide repeat protein [Mariniflexile sp.]|uniref:tetratricopeptide repeat-containing sensor histidine kinase n=1 Tax=Mariniflexile sp. TaxID=1979402 RepID=UPI00356AF4D9
MRKFLTTLYSIILTCSVYSQQNKIDSLTHLLQKHKEEDSIRLKLLNNLSNYYESSDAHQGLIISNQAIALAHKLGQKDHLAQAYLNKAYNYIAVGKDSLALKLYYKSMAIYTSNNKIEGNATALYGIARVYQNWSDYNKAIKFYNKAYILFDSVGNTKNKAAMLNGIGICQMYSSNYPKALESYIKALNIYEKEKLNKTLDYANVLTNIGLIYNRMEHKLHQALEFFNKALIINKEKDYQIGIANILSNMANTHDNLNQPEKAIELQKEAFEMYEKIGNKLGMANALTNIGIAYTSIPDYEKTILYLQKTLPIYEELGNKNNLSLVKYYLGEAYLNLPSTKSNLKKAEKDLIQASIIAKETGNLEIEKETYFMLSKLHAKKGDYKSAFEINELAVILKDSLNSQNLKDEIVRLEVKYDYDKKAAITKTEHESKQALAKAEINRQKLIKKGAIFGGSTLFVLSFLGILLYIRKRDAEEQRQKAELNAKVSETELKALRAQMNPHFIFNALNSINDFISKNDAVSASKYLTKFAKIMRQILENSNQKEITLTEDLNLIEAYIQIEALRLNHKFTYTISIDPAIDTDNTLIPPLILQPFIENSIWHGISKKESVGHIHISLKKEDTMLVCIVEDDGLGNHASVINKNQKSLGQNITKTRIDIINKTKRTNGSVSNIPKEQGFCVEIKLPFQLAY